MNYKKYIFRKTDEEWKSALNSEEYYIMRQKGTEKPYSGEFNNHFERGVYICKGCKQELYDSDSKFDSRCGWPSYEKAKAGAIDYRKDTTHGLIRTEILCSNCGSHQGHVFDDGPTKTGKRYCVNSLSIEFKPNKKSK